MSDLSLSLEERADLVSQLMAARRAVGSVRRTDDKAAENEAHDAVDRARKALGERGPVWWDDGSPDFNRHMVHTTAYAQWFAELAKQRT